LSAQGGDGVEQLTAISNKSDTKIFQTMSSGSTSIDVWHDFAKSRDTTSIDIASLCPNAEITVFPWKEPPELKARTINRARTFLKRYQTA
jgi:hypothetical protein